MYEATQEEKRKVPIRGGSRGISSTDAGGHTVPMSELEVEIAALRARRQSRGFVAWLRSLRPFDRRRIREPDARDAYWLKVQRRLRESDAAFLTRHHPYESSNRTDRSRGG